MGTVLATSREVPHTMLELSVKLRDRHQNWRIWQSDEGRWWAADEQATWPLRDGCVATLDADDPDELETLIDQQEDRRAVSATGSAPDHKESL
jgi:uncharacterized protein YqjF (DUF2071 family)